MRSLLLALALTSAATVASAAELTVRLDGIEPLGGSVRVGLFDSAKGFELRRLGVIAERVVTPDGPSAVVHFDDLAPGRYAVTAFHDANGNGQFDRLFGFLPKEGVALSNDPPLTSAPRFEEMAIEVTATSEVVLRFRYLGG